MDSTILSSLVAVETTCSSPGPVTMKTPSAPAKALPRTYPAVPQVEESIELERIQRPGPSSNKSQESLNHGDLEMSRPTTPVSRHGDSTEVVQSIWEPYMNRFRLLSACLMNFGNGMNDSAPGALIPYMEKYYTIGYGTVSLIFVGNAFGFITAALVLDFLRARLGRARTLALAQALIAAGYLPVVLAAPFPAIVVSFFLVGFGMSVNIALSNVFCGALRGGTTLLGAVHGAYGVGGTVGPLIATALVTVARAGWERYYIITMALAVFNAGFAAWANAKYEVDLGGGSGSAALVGGEAQTSSPSTRLSGMFTAMSSRVVLLGALFIFAYQGAEVSISGWVISFLITTRSGDPSSVGYVTAGFWAGITLGRFCLSTPAHRIGEKRFVYAAVVGAAIFELLVWLVPNVIGDAVAVSIVGLLLGPVYPCAAAVFMKSLSRHEQISGLGVISAFGSSGGAAAPFTTGILAQAVGTFVLHPVAIGLFGAMLVCWYGLPAVRKRTE